MVTRTDDMANVVKGFEGAPEPDPLPQEHPGDFGAKMLTRAPHEVTSIGLQIGKEIPGATNYCAQAAAATVIKAWGAQKGLSDLDLVRDLYTRFPPDLFGGNAGTSPWLVAGMLQAYGLRAQYHSIPYWKPGGFAFNQEVWQPYRIGIEVQVENGMPVVIAVDTGMLPNAGPQSWWSMHYIVYKNITPHGYAQFCNGFGGNTYVDDHMPVSKLHEAWELRAFPHGFPKFIAVTAHG